MSNTIFRVLLTSSALGIFVVIFLINKEEMLFDMEQPFNYINYLLYASIPVLLTWLTTRIAKELETSKLGAVKFVETANNSFLHNYLAFFFIALTVEKTITFIAVFVITFIFIFWSRVSYFNPILLLLGYNFYYVSLCGRQKILLITTEKIKSPEDIIPSKEYNRINDYTFIGRRNNDEL